MLREVKTTPEPIHILQQKYEVVALNTAEMIQLDSLFRRDPSCEASFNAVCNFISGGGTRLTKRNRKEFKVRPAFQRELDSHWMVFGTDLIRNVWCYGLVVVDLDAEQRPYVVDPLTHKIYLVRGPRGYLRFQVLPGAFHSIFSMETQPLKTARVYVERMPHHTGSITSKVASLRQMAQMQNHMVGCTARAAARRCVPPLVMEHNPANPAQTQMQRDINQAGDHQDLLFENSEQVDESALAQARVNADLQARLNEEMDRPHIEPNDPVTGEGRYPADGGESFYHSRIIVDSGKHLVPAPLVESPSEIIDIMYIAEADVGKVLGIPPHFWGSQRAAVAVDQMVMVVFRATLQALKEILAHVFQDMLQTENIAHAALNLNPEKNLQENLEDHGISVTFPGLQDPDSIQRLLDMGAMTWDKARYYVAPAYQVPLEDLATELVDARTGEPLRDQVEFERGIQEQQLENDIKVSQAKQKTEGTVAVKNLAQATAAKRKATPTSSSTAPATKKRQQTRVANARKDTARTSKRQVNQ